MGNAQRLSPCRVMIIHNNRSKYGAIANGVGENPLNGKGMPLTDNAEGENIVCSLCEGKRLYNSYQIERGKK